MNQETECWIRYLSDVWLNLGEQSLFSLHLNWSTGGRARSGYFPLFPSQKTVGSGTKIVGDSTTCRLPYFHWLRRVIFTALIPKMRNCIWFLSLLTLPSSAYFRSFVPWETSQEQSAPPFPSDSRKGTPFGDTISRGKIQVPDGLSKKCTFTL